MVLINTSSNFPQLMSYYWLMIDSNTHNKCRLIKPLIYSRSSSSITITKVTGNERKWKTNLNRKRKHLDRFTLQIGMQNLALQPYRRKYGEDCRANCLGTVILHIDSLLFVYGVWCGRCWFFFIFRFSLCGSSFFLVSFYLFPIHGSIR